MLSAAGRWARDKAAAARRSLNKAPPPPFVRPAAGSAPLLLILLAILLLLVLFALLVVLSLGTTTQTPAPGATTGLSPPAYRRDPGGAPLLRGPGTGTGGEGGGRAPPAPSPAGAQPDEAEEAPRWLTPECREAVGRLRDGKLSSRAEPGHAGIVWASRRLSTSAAGYGCLLTSPPLLLQSHSLL
jgi:hypothetical protein